MSRKMIPITEELKNLFSCTDCSAPRITNVSSFTKNRIKSDSTKLNGTEDCVDYDEGGEPVTLNHLKCDEGQQGTEPILMTRNLMKLIGRDLNVVVNKTSNSDCANSSNPREIELKFEGRKAKVCQVGEKFYAKLSECNVEDKIDTKKANQSNCCKKFKIKNEKLTLIGKIDNPPTSGICGLGKSYGIQLGSISIEDEFFPTEIRGKQALDSLLVAHGFTSMKAPVNWSQNDIDSILNLGTELFKSTKHEAIDKHSGATKGFTLNKKFIEVSMSEPIYIGKISSVNDRSMNLFKALNSFFKQHQFGIFQSSTVDLYIAVKDSAFVVFSPRGRSMDCDVSSCGEAALMVFQSIENLSYLITHRSNIDDFTQFELRAVSIARIVESKYAEEKFAVIKRTDRSGEFQFLSIRVSILRGNLHLRSKIFEHVDGRQHLTASVMSMIYAKIDPPNSWSSNILDRVLHFGTKFYLNCIGNGPLRDLKLIDIPSEFYVGDAYRAKIAIVPFLKTVEIMSSGLFSDDTITKAIKSAFDLSFRCLLLQIDNVSISIWQMRTYGNFFFLYDGYQKDSMGNPDYFDGRATLLMFTSLDDLCKNVGERTGKNTFSSSSKMCVHGLRVIELLPLGTKAPHKQHGKLPKLVLRKLQPVHPLGASCANLIEDSPSIQDSIVPLLTTNQHEMLRTQTTRQKPEYLTTTNLNSSSLVCGPKGKINESFEEKELASDIVKDFYENIIKRATVEGLGSDEGEISKLVEGKTKETETCNRFVTCAEKVLLKTDLRCLQRERDDIINNFSDLVDPFQVLTEAKTNESQVSHFRKLPDMSAIVRGTRALTAEFPVERIFTIENLSVITAISALITSSFHPVESWSCETIDCVISSAYCMSNFIQLSHRFDFSTIVEHRMPKVQIENRLFNVKMVAIANGEWSDFGKTLNHLISSHQTSFILVTSHGSLAVFSRQNFLFCFEYATCNFLGHRSDESVEEENCEDDASSSCLLRFRNIPAMLKRIFANHPEMKRQQRFLICQVMMEKIEGECEAAFVPFTKSHEKEIVDKMLQAALDKLKERLNPIDKAIELEKQRIRNYYDETGQTRRLDLNGNDMEFSVDDFKLRILQDNCDDDNANLAVTSRTYYRQNEYDYVSGTGYSNHPNRQHPMILGSFAYRDRMTSDCKLKPCHFACIFAYLLSIHHPVETMNGEYVDFILENGAKIYKRIDVDEYLKCTKLDKVVLDEIEYNAQLGELNNENALDTVDLLSKFFKVRKYAILQAANCSMLLFKHKNYFIIFDAYDECETKTNEVRNADPHHSAAFIQFLNLIDAICYANDRMCSPLTIRSINISTCKKIRNKNFPTPSSKRRRSDAEDGSCKYAEHSADEKLDWIYGIKTIPWRYTTSICKEMRKWKEFSIVIDNKLFSLWGNLHPSMEMFKKHSGKQFLACSVLSLVMAQLYDINEWDDALLDSIVAHGHKYHIETVSKITEENHRLQVEELNRFCCIGDMRFEISVESAAYGVLYDDSNDFLSMNLNKALKFIFDVKKLPGVVLQCNGKFLAIGNVRNRDYFMFDCQSHGSPIFPPHEGRVYMLKCCCMKILVACIVLTLNVRSRNVKFFMYEVKTKLSKEKCDENYGNQATGSQQENESSDKTSPKVSAIQNGS